MNHSLDLMDYMREEIEDAKQHNKTKLHKLLDKYGSVEGIEDNAVGVDEYEYMFANVNNLIDEVLEERRTGKYNLSKSLPKIERVSTNTLANESDEMPKEIKSAKRQTTNTDKLSPLDHLRAIRALRNRPNPEDSADLPQKELKYADNEYAGVKSDGNYERDNTLYTNKIFERVLAKTWKEEGGYEDDKKKIDAPTNFGIRQNTLDRFKKAHPNKAVNFPKHVKNLTRDQARLIVRIDFFDYYRIAELKSEPLQETLFDTFFNHSPYAPALWIQKSINDSTNINVAEDGIFGSETIKALNSLSLQETKRVNNKFIDMREADYEKEKKNNTNPYYKTYTVGLPNRFNRFRIK